MIRGRKRPVGTWWVKKSRHLGIGVFIDIWSMGKRLHAFEVLLGITFEQILPQVGPANLPSSFVREEGKWRAFQLILPQVGPANLPSSFVRSIEGRREVESISAKLSKFCLRWTRPTFLPPL